MWFIYSLIMYLFVFGIRVSSLWNPKSKQWVKGRKDWLSKIQALPPKSDYRIWFHVSSLGEFEQARTVIERIKELRPGTEIILTFFSPSGYEQRKNYTGASVFYLPADLPGNAKKWLTVVLPDLAVFVKYDLWPGYLKTLGIMQIPSILISAHWLPQRGFNSWSNPLTRNLLKNFKMIFLQEDDYLAFFKKSGYTNLQVSGDTRIDRSLKLPEEALNRISPALMSMGTFDLIAGSTWPADEELLIHAMRTMKLKILIAPHDVTVSNVDRLIKKIRMPAKKLSELTTIDRDVKVVVVDSIGLLSALYALGRIAYVGGGFGKCIHNILEPMAHAKPVIFGPHFEKFPEAVDMVKQKGAWSVTSSQELLLAVEELITPGRAEDAGRISHQYLIDHAGASTMVTDYILKSIPYIS